MFFLRSPFTLSLAVQDRMRLNNAQINFALCSPFTVFAPIFYLNVIIMASKRDLKKEINAVVGALIGEYLLTTAYIPGIDIEKANTVLNKILEMRKEYITRVGANGGNEPKQVREYYKKFKAYFNAQVDEIISDFESLTK